MIAVMVQGPEDPGFRRHFFAVGQDDQARAEWAAIDRAMRIGRVAESPVRGLEPVHAIQELSALIVRVMALKSGETRPLGALWPKRWIGVEKTRIREEGP